MTEKSIQDLQMEIWKLTQELNAKQRDAVGTPVQDYEFANTAGAIKLSQLFGGKDKLLVIHNMGQGCRYCTLWGDGINGLLPHLESAVAVALVSKDPPEVQRRFANARGWRVEMVSHGGGAYSREQMAVGAESDQPGIACYERRGGDIYRKTTGQFGPGDMFCPQWHLLALAGISPEDWTPQYSYWQRPEKLDDGGENVIG